MSVIKRNSPHPQSYRPDLPLRTHHEYAIGGCQMASHIVKLDANTAKWADQCVAKHATAEAPVNG